MLALAGALLLGGCGGEDPGERNVSPAGDTLPAVLVARVERARDKIKRFCRDVGSPETEKAVATLIEIYRANRNALFESGDVARRRTMRDVLAQQALRLSRCGAEPQARRLESALLASGG